MSPVFLGPYNESQWGYYYFFKISITLFAVYGITFILSIYFKSTKNVLETFLNTLNLFVVTLYNKVPLGNVSQGINKY